jgi:hypothetical protein
VARREVLPEVRHRTSRYLNNRAENCPENKLPVGLLYGTAALGWSMTS